MKKARQGKPFQVAKNVRIVTLSDVPPAFLLRPKVVAAIRREVVNDLKNGLRRVPSGCEVEWHDPGLLRRLKIKLEELWTKISTKF